MAMTDHEVGENLRRLRVVLRISQAGLAEALTQAGVPYIRQQTIVHIEKGRRPLKLSEALAIADILEVDLGALLAPDRSDEMVQALALDRRLSDCYLNLGRALLNFRTAKTNLSEHLSAAGLTPEERDHVVHPAQDRLLELPEPEVIEAMLDPEKARALGLLPL